jgi:hypothetical protein
VVMGDTLRGTAQTMQITRRRLAIDLDPRLSTR